MSLSNAGDPGNLKEAKLPLRDWLLLPLLSLLTMLALILVPEESGRKLFPAEAGSMSPCIVKGNAPTETRAIPNSVCHYKTLDSPMVEYRFNACGHRTDMKCGVKPDGAYRIVVVGSSMTMGSGVRVEDAFATTLPAALSQRTGRTVDLYNEAIAGPAGDPFSIANRFSEVLAAKPDLILWVLTPGDIYQKDPGQSNTPAPQSGKEAEPGSRSLPLMNLFDRAVAPLRGSAIKVFMEHYIYKSQYILVNSASRSGEDTVGFMRQPTSALWLERIQQFDGNAQRIMEQAQKAGVPVVAVVLPADASAAMISRGSWPAEFDPYWLGGQVRTVVESRGGIYLDILHGLRTIPEPDRNYYPVNGHPDAAGHAVLSRLMADGLTDGIVPALKVAANP